MVQPQWGQVTRWCLPKISVPQLTRLRPIFGISHSLPALPCTTAKFQFACIQKWQKLPTKINMRTYRKLGCETESHPRHSSKHRYLFIYLLFIIQYFERIAWLAYILIFPRVLYKTCNNANIHLYNKKKNIRDMID